MISPSYLFRKGCSDIGQLHSLAKPPGPFPCTRIKEDQSPDNLPFPSSCQATGHNINPPNVKVLSAENNTIKSRVKEAIAIKQRTPPTPRIWMRDWTYQQVKILSTLMKSERFGRNIRFVPNFFRSEFWNFLH